MKYKRKYSPKKGTLYQSFSKDHRLHWKVKLTSQVQPYHPALYAVGVVGFTSATGKFKLLTCLQFVKGNTTLIGKTGVKGNITVQQHD